MATSELKRFREEQKVHGERFDARTGEEFLAMAEAIREDIKRAGGNCWVGECTLTNPKNGLPSQWTTVIDGSGQVVSAYNITNPCPPIWEVFRQQGETL